MNFHSSPDSKLHTVDTSALCSLTPDELQQIHDVLSWVYPDSFTYKRYAAVLYLSQGKTITEVARLLQQPSATIQRHLSRFNEMRLPRFSEKHLDFLTDAQKQELQQELDVQETNKSIRNRCQALLDYSKGRTIQSILEDLSCSPIDFQNYRQNYQLYGLAGLADLKRRVTIKHLVSDLSEDQIRELQYTLEHIPPYMQFYKYVQAIFLLSDRHTLIHHINQALSLSEHQLKKIVVLYLEGGLEALRSLKEKVDYKTMNQWNLQLTTEQQQYASEWIDSAASGHERKRGEVILAFNRGIPIRDIARRMKYTEDNVIRILQLFIEQGWEALRIPKKKLKKTKEVNQFEQSDEYNQIKAILADLPESSSKRITYRIIQLYFSGHTGQEVAKILDCSEGIAYKVIRRFKEGGLSALKKLETSFQTQQLSDDVLQQLQSEIAKLPAGSKNRRLVEAVYLYGKGISKSQIARELGIGSSTVRTYIKQFTAEGLSAFQRPKPDPKTVPSQKASSTSTPS